MFCPNCGKEVPTNASFCVNCGFKVADLNVAAPAAEVPAQEPVIEIAPAAPEQEDDQPVIEIAPAASEQEDAQSVIEIAPVQSAETAQPEAPVIQTTQPVMQPAQTGYEQRTYDPNQFQNVDDNETLILITKIFLIIGCVIGGICGFLIPLAWCIPMTVVIFKKFKTGQPIGTGLKVCTLIFVSLIAGICMLCMKEPRK